jgi:hypothetical protein
VWKIYRKEESVGPDLVVNKSIWGTYSSGKLTIEMIEELKTFYS